MSFRIIIASVFLLSLAAACPCPARAEDSFSTREPLPAYHDNSPLAAEPSDQPGGNTFLPAGDLFRPLIADPKEWQFYLSYRIVRYQSLERHEAVGGYGMTFGLYRHADTTGGYSWQANVGGGIHAQFDLDEPSLDLINTDYVVGLPFSFRKGPVSYRVTLFHQSSHLGDEFLLHNDIKRIEFSIEAIDALGSYEWTKWRVYYGGQYIFHREPSDYRPASLHGGIEYYGSEYIIGTSRLVGGLDLKSMEEHDWSLDSSAKFGLQFDSSAHNGRYIRLVAEGYEGFTPYGQFFTQRMKYLGVGIYLGI